MATLFAASAPNVLSDALLRDSAVLSPQAEDDDDARSRLDLSQVRAQPSLVVKRGGLANKAGRLEMQCNAMQCWFCLSTLHTRGPFKGVASQCALPLMLLAGQVSEIAASFRNIAHVAHLDGLKNLTRLRLDNNIISDIQGLEQLPNLTALDLSFNNIAHIKGLESLVRLTDLSLFHNR